MWLLIDDERNLNVDVIAKTYESGMKLLWLGGWDCVLLDHDLCDTDPSHTGYDLLVYGITHNLLPRHIQLVTANPVGHDRMLAALYQDGYTTKNFKDFFKD